MEKQRSQLDDKNLTFETSEEVQIYTTFESMGLKENLLRGIHGYGFEKPSAV